MSPAGHRPRAVLRRAGCRAAALLLGLVLQSPVWAGADLLCTQEREPTVARQDRALRFSAALREILEASGQDLALVARDGLDLRRFGQRYSHAGLTLRENPAGPWAVRQLYFDCDSGRPRLFDQGLSAFVQGGQRAGQGFVSLLMLPAEAALPLRTVALDSTQALALLHPDYSANAYVFGLRFQNCNQWLAELFGAAWGGARDRREAQAWLQAQGYAGTELQLPGRPWLWLAAFSPWLHLQDHPEADLAAARQRISLPQGLMDWLLQRFPGGRRVDLCELPGGLLVREGGFQPGEDCSERPGDRWVAAGP